MHIEELVNLLAIFFQISQLHNDTDTYSDMFCCWRTYCANEFPPFLFMTHSWPKERYYSTSFFLFEHDFRFKQEIYTSQNFHAFINQWKRIASVFFYFVFYLQFLKSLSKFGISNLTFQTTCVKSIRSWHTYPKPFLLYLYKYLLHMYLVHQNRNAVQSTIKVINCITLSTIIAFKIYTYFPTGMFWLLFTKPLCFKNYRIKVEMLLDSFLHQFDLNSYWPLPFPQCVEIFSEGIFPILLILQFHEIFITNSYWQWYL